jgi:hypothetical protein
MPASGQAELRITWNQFFGPPVTNLAHRFATRAIWALTLFSVSLGAPLDTPPSGGLWKSDGYGLLLEIYCGNVAGVADRSDRPEHAGRVSPTSWDARCQNGWSFALPNEVYPTKNGKAFDGTGVPPDVRVPFFSREDLAAGRDAELDQPL